VNAPTTAERRTREDLREMVDEYLPVHGPRLLKQVRSDRELAELELKLLERRIRNDMAAGVRELRARIGELEQEVAELDAELDRVSQGRRK
jgi:uncharacterized small protein (DUF1192 family)